MPLSIMIIVKIQFLKIEKKINTNNSKSYFYQILIIQLNKTDF